jgi:hypothetical protein
VLDVVRTPELELLYAKFVEGHCSIPRTRSTARAPMISGHQHRARRVRRRVLSCRIPRRCQCANSEVQ